MNWFKKEKASKGFLSAWYDQSDDLTHEEIKLLNKAQKRLDKLQDFFGKGISLYGDFIEDYNEFCDRVLRKDNVNPASLLTAAIAWHFLTTEPLLKAYSFYWLPDEVKTTVNQMLIDFRSQNKEIDETFKKIEKEYQS